MITMTAQPTELFPAWAAAQHIAGRHATGPLPSVAALRGAGLLPRDRAARIAAWYTGPPVSGEGNARVAYDAAALCDDLRQRATMMLRSAAADPPHPVLSNATIDRLRTVHDVLGHAALGLGFDLQSEYAAWVYCRALFSPTARPAAFCEMVGAVTAYVVTGTEPALRADLPPAGL